MLLTLAKVKNLRKGLESLKYQNLFYEAPLRPLISRLRSVNFPELHSFNEGVSAGY